MLGYAASIGTYRLWDAERNKVIIGRHVKFNEREVLDRAKVVELPDSGAEPATAADNKGVEEDDEFADARDKSFDRGVNNGGAGNKKIHGVNQGDAGNYELNGGQDANEIVIPRRSTRERRKPDRFADSEYSVHYALSAEQFVDGDPVSMKEAMARADRSEWKKAIDCEYDALIKNGTWTECDLLKNRQAISCKWVFKLKRTAHGEIDKYKARLVARGFTQKEGFDYEETYTPVVKLTTLRILLSVANHMSMHIHQMDVKSAFLNGELREEIYMHRPEGFKEDGRVLKLKRALYGLKQASRMWNESFNGFMIGAGFRRCDSDRCLYVKNDDGTWVYILLYVDDLLIMSGDMRKIFGNVVSWCSRKQATISQSSTEAEYIALAQAVNEAKWIRSILGEIGIKIGTPITIFEDNQSCIRIAEEPREHKRMKHIDIKYCFIRDEIANGTVKVEYKPTADQTADIMTKGLGRNLFIKHRGKLNLI